MTFLLIAVSSQIWIIPVYTNDVNKELVNESFVAMIQYQQSY